MRKYPANWAMPKGSLEERFWPLVNKSVPNGCWEWTRSKNHYGYGQITFRRVLKLAHRVAWELTCGPIPIGAEVCHKCDNPGCVKPAHLFLGTHVDNFRDAVNKDRFPHGVNHHAAKLTEEAVREIRRARTAKVPRSVLAARYDVDPMTITLIMQGKRWRRVDA